MSITYCDGLRSAATALLLATLVGPVEVSAQTLGVVQFAPVVDAPSLSPGAAQQFEQRLAAALARGGIGRAFAENDPRFLAVGSVIPLNEEMIPGTPPMIGFRTEVSVAFLDGVSGATFAEYSAEATAVGRNREDASRNIARSLRLSGESWRSAVETAQENAVEFFERQCDLILEEADVATAAGDLERALVNLASVPQEASACKSRSNKKQLEVFEEFQRRICAADFAQAFSLWAIDKSRDSAAQVGATLAMIPAGSPCFDEAFGLLDEVAATIEAYDRGEAERLREQLVYERQRAADREAYERQLAADSEAREMRAEQRLERRQDQEIERSERRQDQEMSLEILRLEASERVALEAGERVGVAWVRSRSSRGG